MFITPHTAAGIWIATKVVDPLSGFIFGVISHFILDIIPHGNDEVIGDHKRDPHDRHVYRMKVGLVDMTLSALMIYFFIVNHPGINRAILYAAVFGTWLPDLMWVGIEAVKAKYMYWYLSLHSKIHNLVNWKYSLVYGVPFQILFTLLMIKISF